MGRSTGSGINHSHSSVDSNRRKYFSRFPVQTRHLPVDFHVKKKHVLSDSGSFPTAANLGCLRLPLVGPTPSLHVMAQGSSCCGSGCFAGSVGPSHIPVSTGSLATQGGQEGEGREVEGHIDLSSVANSSMVGSSARDDSGTSPGASALQIDRRNIPSRPVSSLSGTSGGLAHFRQEFNLSNSGLDLDQDDLSFLSNHLATSTATGYGYIFAKFRSFCEKLSVDPFTCPPSVIVKYLRQLSEAGAEYSTVNVHRSSISKFHAGFAGKPVGEHPLISQAVKAVFRLKPPLPKYQSTFDIVPVLAYMRTLNTHTISLQLLTYKALFLTVYSNICRVSSMARLGPSLTEHRDSVVLHLVDLEKQARHGRVRGFFQIPKFDEDPQLCPVVTLVAYFNKVYMIFG